MKDALHRACCTHNISKMRSRLVYRASNGKPQFWATFDQYARKKPRNEWPAEVVPASDVCETLSMLSLDVQDICLKICLCVPLHPEYRSGLLATFFELQRLFFLVIYYFYFNGSEAIKSKPDMSCIFREIDQRLPLLATASQEDIFRDSNQDSIDDDHDSDNLVDEYLIGLIADGMSHNRPLYVRLAMDALSGDAKGAFGQYAAFFHRNAPLLNGKPLTHLASAEAAAASQAGTSPVCKVLIHRGDGSDMPDDQCDGMQPPSIIVSDNDDPVVAASPVGGGDSHEADVDSVVLVQADDMIVPPSTGSKSSSRKRPRSLTVLPTTSSSDDDDAIVNDPTTVSLSNTHQSSSAVQRRHSAMVTITPSQSLVLSSTSSSSSCYSDSDDIILSPPTPKRMKISVNATVGSSSTTLPCVPCLLDG